MEISIKRKNEIKKYLFIFSIIGIQLICFCVFYIYKNFKSIIMAFQLKDINGNQIWTFENFTQIYNEFFIIDDGAMIKSLVNTIKFFVLSNIMFIVSFTTSFFIYKKILGYKIFRVVYFLPCVLSSVLWSMLYKNMVGTEGPIAILFSKMLNLDEVPSLLGDSRYALGTVMAYSIWLGIAGNFVLFGGTLSRIPDSLIEVGRLDGMNWIQEIRYVIIPLIWPTLSTMFLLNLIGVFTASGNILLLTGGEYGTNTISFFLFTRVYGNAETSNSYNYASAFGLILTILTIPIVFFANHFLNKINKAEY